MSGLWTEPNEVPEIVVGRLALRDLVMGLRLDGVDEVGKVDSVLDEENGYVVADNVPITFGGVELDGEAPHISNGVSATLRSLDGAKPNEDWGGAARVCEDGCEGVLLGSIVEHAEVPMGASTTSMHDSLGDTLMVEPVDFLSGDMILEQSGADIGAIGHAQPMERYELQASTNPACSSPMVGVAHLHAMVSRHLRLWRWVDGIPRQILDLCVVCQHTGNGVLDRGCDSGHEGARRERVNCSDRSITTWALYVSRRETIILRGRT